MTRKEKQTNEENENTNHYRNSCNHGNIVQRNKKGCAVERTEDVAVVTRTVEQYEVQFGDSLSSITAKYCPEYIDSRKYLYDLQRLNERQSNIYAGEVLKIYVYR